MSANDNNGFSRSEMDKEIRELFPYRLRKIREEIGISQEQFANELGVSRAAIGYYESGKRIPDIAFIYALHTFTGVNINYIFGIEESMKPIVNTQLSVNELDDQQLENLAHLLRSHSFMYSLSHDEISELFAWLDEVSCIQATGVKYMTRELVEYKAASKLGEIIGDVYYELCTHVTAPRSNKDSEEIKRITAEYYQKEYDKAQEKINELIPSEILERERKREQIETLSYEEIMETAEKIDSTPIGRFRMKMEGREYKDGKEKGC